MLAKINNRIVQAKDLWKNKEGKAGWALLWLLGVPLPVLLIIYFLRGCQ